MWISTNEPPGVLKEVFMRVGARADKFYVFDFPRAFRGNIAKFVADHIHEYEALVVDAVNGIAPRDEKLEELVHGFLYQLSKDMPIVAVGRAEKVFYIADNLIKVGYKENALGHTVRYIKLVKSRFAPPSERYLFDFVEGVGLVYIYPNKKPIVAETPLSEDAELLGVGELYKSGVVGVFSTSKKKLAEKLEEVASRREVFYLSLFPPTTLPVDLGEGKMRVATTFKDVVEVVYNIYSGRVKPNVFVVSGLRDLERILGNDVVDYITAVGSVARYVDYIIDLELATEGAWLTEAFLDVKKVV